MKKKGHLNWFFWFMMCIFFAVVFKEADGNGSVFQIFSQSLIKVKLPYLHNLIALAIGGIILAIAYFIAIFFVRIIDDIFNDGQTIATFFGHDNTKVLKNITDGIKDSDEEF